MNSFLFLKKYCCQALPDLQTTDKVGHGYDGYSMSNNARVAYSQGVMPYSKWTKTNLIQTIKDIVEKYNIPFDVSKIEKTKFADLKSEYLKQEGYHHTSKFYNATEFYKVDIEKILENKEEINNPNIYYQAMIAGINPKQKVDVVDLSAAFVNDKNISVNALSSYLKTLIGQSFSDVEQKSIINFVSHSKRIGKRNVYIPSHIANSSKVETQYKGERKTFVKNIVNLIQQSVLIDIDKNRDKKTKPNVDNYLRFYIPVRINNDIFTVRITAENKKNNIKLLNANVYDVIIDKKMMSKIHQPANAVQLTKTSSNNIITQSPQTSSVEKITIEEMLKGIQDPDGNVYFQSIDNIKQNFDYSAQELEEMFKADVLNILQENMIDESEFNFEDIKLYGSYTKGKNKSTSDLDVLVQYSGLMREDDAFNLLNEQNLTITDVNGNEVKVDINPINVAESVNKCRSGIA